MEPESLLSHSQETATCPCTELCCTNESVQVGGLVKCYVTPWLAASRPTLKLKDHALSAVRDC